MWELRLVDRDPRRELVGFARGGDVAETVEGQQIRGSVVGGAPPSPGQPVLVTGEPGNWTISGLVLDPSAALTPITPISTPQAFDRKGCGKCWRLEEFESEEYQRRGFGPGYIEDEDDPEVWYPLARFVEGRLESVKVPRYGVHSLVLIVYSAEPCLALNRPTGAWARGKLAAPLPEGSQARAYIRGRRLGGSSSRFLVPIQVDGVELRAGWSGIPHSEHPDEVEDTWLTNFWILLELPYDAPIIAITELEICLGSVAYARVTSE